MGDMDSRFMCAECYTAPGAESGLCLHVLPFECLWVRHLPSLSSSVEWKNVCSVHPTALIMTISVKCLVTFVYFANRRRYYYS